MRRLTSVCVFLFSALALAFTSGYSLAAVLMLLASMSLLWTRPRIGLQGPDYLLMGTLFLYFFIYTANMFLHGDPGREYDMPSRALLAIPVLLLLRAYPPRPAAWWSGVAVGAMAGAALAFTQFFTDGLARPQAATSNAIHYGNVSMLLGMLSLCGVAWARHQSRRAAWTVLMVAGCLAGVAGSIISGSRGGWLALPICTVILAVHYSRQHGKRYLLGALATLAALVAMAYVVPSSPVRERTIAAMNELNSFETTGNIYSSVGQRFEMWRSAWYMSSENILVGIGRTGYLAEKQEMAAEGRMNAVARDFTNAHNDYLDALVKRGLIGLLTLLALFFLPMKLFIDALRHAAPQVQPVAMAGIILLTCYITFGLTTTSLTLNIGIVMLIFPLVILWSLLHDQPRRRS